MSINKLTLESWLWDSANILRVSIDSSHLKNYIFGLFFSTRSNDVFEEGEEEVENIMKRENVSREEVEDDTYFQLPEESIMETIKKHTENTDIALANAFATIEHENTSLVGVMTATKFGDKEKLSHEIFQCILRHFNQYSLSYHHLESSDLLVYTYEYLIKLLADDVCKIGGEFYTPRGVV